MRSTRDASLRSLTAVLLLLGLLSLVASAYWARGFDEAQKLYVLVQGLVLPLLGWLYGSHGIERAQRAADEAEAARVRVAHLGETTEERCERLEAEAQLARRALHAAMTVPEAARKVQAILREVPREDQE